MQASDDAEEVDELDLPSLEDGDFVDGVLVPTNPVEDEAIKAPEEEVLTVDDFVAMAEANAMKEEDSKEEAQSLLKVYTCPRCHSFKDEGDANISTCTVCRGKLTSMVLPASGGKDIMCEHVEFK